MAVEVWPSAERCLLYRWKDENGEGVSAVRES